MPKLSDKVSVIIPVYNLKKRGYNRIINSITSLFVQSDCIQDIIIVNGSDDKEYLQLDSMIMTYDIKHTHYPLKEFNKPKLLNKGIKESKSKWIMCTDADYLFKCDFLRQCEKHRSQKRILFKKVKMLPNIGIKKSQILRWQFPKCKYNQWGTIANGACQYSTRDFFLKHKYPEEMSGFGAMDNIMAYIAYNNGLEIKWIDESEILHQYHKTEPKLSGSNKLKFERNQKILDNYMKSNKLGRLLSKYD